MYCPTHQIRQGGRCLPVVTKIYTKAIGLMLKSAGTIGKLPGPDILRKGSDDPEKMLRSKCLDFQWTYVSVDAEYNNGENETHSILLTMLKTFKNPTGFLLPNMLDKMTTCFSTPWEILLNEHWFTVSFKFPKAERRMAVETGLTGISRSRFEPVSVKSYSFTKLDFCPQVYYTF